MNGQLVSAVRNQMKCDQVDSATASEWLAESWQPVCRGDGTVRIGSRSTARRVAVASATSTLSNQRVEAGAELPLRLAMILVRPAFGPNGVGVMSRRHLDFDREIVGDRVYRGPVTIAYRSPE